MNGAGEQIKRLRLYLKLTQEEFAKALNYKRNSISMIESNRNKPTFELITSICITYNIPAEYFFHDDNPASIKGLIVTNNDIETLKESKNVNHLGLEVQNPSIENGYPKSYINNNAPIALERRMMSKVENELRKEKNNRSDLYTSINTVLNFMFIIQNLDHYYFEAIDKKFYEINENRNEKSFDYLNYKSNIYKEIDKLIDFSQPLEDLSNAIIKFYEDVKIADHKGIVEGYLTGTIKTTSDNVTHT